MNYRIMSKFCLMPLLGLLFCGQSYGITIGAPFGPNGAGGAINGQALTIGTDGSTFEVDSFVNIDGLDLNGANDGTSAQLSFLGSGDSLPTGLDYSFNAAISADTTDLVLNYIFSNNTGADILGFTFLTFLDADIGGFDNDFATTTGTQVTGQNFQVDDPFGAFPNIFDNLLSGTLDNNNAFGGLGSLGDVAMGLSWDIDTLLAGSIASFSVLISEDGGSLGSFFISQEDEDQLLTSAIVTYSGAYQVTAVPEPGTLFLLVSGMFVLMNVSRRSKFAE